MPLAAALGSFLQCQEPTQMLSARCDNKSQMTATLTKTFPGQLCGKHSPTALQAIPAVQWHKGDGDPRISYARGGINTPSLPPCPRREPLSSWGPRPWLQEGSPDPAAWFEMCTQLPHTHILWIILMKTLQSWSWDR